MAISEGSSFARLTLPKTYGEAPIEAMAALYQQKYKEHADQLAAIQQQESILGKNIDNPYYVLPVNGQKQKIPVQTGVNKIAADLSQQLQLKKSEIAKKLNENFNYDTTNDLNDLKKLVRPLSTLSTMIDNQNEYVKGLDKILLEDKDNIDGRYLGINKQTSEIVNSANPFYSKVSSMSPEKYMDTHKTLLEAANEIDSHQSGDLSSPQITGYLGSIHKAVVKNQSFDGINPDDMKRLLTIYSQSNPELKQYLDNKVDAEIQGRIYAASKDPETAIKLISPIAEKDLRDNSNLPLNVRFTPTERPGIFKLKNGKLYDANQNPSQKDTEEYLKKYGEVRKDITGEDIMKNDVYNSVYGVIDGVSGLFNRTTKSNYNVVGDGSENSSDKPNYSGPVFTPTNEQIIVPTGTPYALATDGEFITKKGLYTEDGKYATKDLLISKVLNMPEFANNPKERDLAIKYIDDNYDDYKGNAESSWSIGTGLANGITNKVKNIFTVSIGEDAAYNLLRNLEAGGNKTITIDQAEKQIKDSNPEGFNEYQDAVKATSYDSKGRKLPDSAILHNKTNYISGLLGVRSYTPEVLNNSKFDAKLKVPVKNVLASALIKRYYTPSKEDTQVLLPDQQYDLDNISIVTSTDPGSLTVRTTLKGTNEPAYIKIPFNSLEGQFEQSTGLLHRYNVYSQVKTGYPGAKVGDNGIVVYDKNTGQNALKVNGQIVTLDEISNEFKRISDLK